MELELKTFIEERFSNIHHRQLMVISGAEIWCTDIVEQLVNLVPSDSKPSFSLLSCNTDLPKGDDSPKTNNGQYRHHLGREYDWVVYNAWRGIRANSLAALSGTVKSNGLFILICPEFAHWQQHRDAETHLRISYGMTEQVSGSHFVQHLIDEISSSDNCILIDEKGVSGQQTLVDKSLLNSQDNLTSQTRIIEKIEKVASGHRKRPLVISADRGRGKSSALGIAAANLAKREGKKIIITAPQKNAVETLFKHARENFSNSDDFVSFCAVDDLIINEPFCDLLMVDEAAGIPVHQLIKLTCRYSRILFTTTVNGYEGSGRGFEVRFKPWLLQNRPGAKFEAMTSPFRWFEQDCLEEFWWQSLHLKPFKRENFTGQPFFSNDLLFEEVDQESLVEDKENTNRIFSLLINAHYQTSPDDFVALLDAPEQKLFVARDKSTTIIGVLLINLEGKITDEELGTNIIKGQRRVQGHMLPQQLALATCDKAWLKLNYLRVIRIAVAEQYRQQGIGSLLIEKLKEWSLQRNIDYIGSSFGANTNLASFWFKNQFSPALLGFHRDKATAEFNLTVLQCNKQGELPAFELQQLSESLRSSLLFHATDIFKDLETEMLLLLLQKTLSSDADFKAILEEHRQKLDWFCHGNRSLEHTAPVLPQLFNLAHTFDTLNGAEIALLTDYILKRKSVSEIAKKYQLEGLRGFLKALKLALAKLLGAENK